MRLAHARRHLALVLLASHVLVAAPAFAGDTSTAEQLFADGLKAMEKKDYAAACAAFQGSQEADPSPGTLINLATCHEKQGKVATAWGEFLTAAGMAEQRGQTQRVQLARDAAAKLEPQLHRLVIDVREPSDGLQVTRDGVAVPRATFGRPIPVDPGEHTIEATAPGKISWKGTATTAAGPGVDTIAVPPLEDAPREPAKPVGGTLQPTAPPAEAPSNSGSTQRTIGIILGATGIAALGTGGAFQLVALGEDSTSDRQRDSIVANCVQGNPPDSKPVDGTDCGKLKASQISHADAAKQNQLTAIVLGAGGVAMIGVGLVLYFTAPTAKASTSAFRVLPDVAPGRAGLTLGATF